jgi:nucleotide-binding universal stress UspA family protein
MSPAGVSLKHILVATDFSSHADAMLRRALAVAQASQSHVTVLHVLTHLDRSQLTLAFDAESKRVTADLDPYDAQVCRETEARIVEFARARQSGQVDFEPEVRIGPPSLATAQSAVRHHSDLVFVGTRGLTGFERLVLGSTTQELIRHSSAAIWAVQADSLAPVKSILAATDLSDPSGRALALAATLATDLRATLHVLHAIDGAPEVQTMDFNDELPQLSRRHAEQEHRHRLTEFVKVHAGDVPPERLHIGWGKPADVIIDRAAKLNTDLVVLGTIGRSGVQGLLLGNTAETVLHNVKCDVLAVKPSREQ